ncbi:MAG: HesA/MoeB/ThiF family protein [Promethearchaeota archaeon]
MLTNDEQDRYQRQILTIGEKKQQLLATKTVLQVGAGGLGSPLALYLVAAGVGTLIIFETDTVSLSNLGRQVLYTTEDVGKSKAILAKQRLRALNPNVNIIVIEEWLTRENAPIYLEKYNVDYLVDASDNFETKFLINDLGIQFKIPTTIAGISGFEGQILSIIPGQSACYRCIFGEPPKKKDTAPIPVMSPTCGVLGSLEANEVIKGLLGMKERLLNKLLMVSLDSGDFTKIKISINPKCLCQNQR